MPYFKIYEIGMQDGDEPVVANSDQLISITWKKWAQSELRYREGYYSLRFTDNIFYAVYARSADQIIEDIHSTRSVGEVPTPTK